jgi:hypothetical protein
MRMYQKKTLTPKTRILRNAAKISETFFATNVSQ